MDMLHARRADAWVVYARERLSIAPSRLTLLRPWLHLASVCHANTLPRHSCCRVGDVHGLERNNCIGAPVSHTVQADTPELYSSYFRLSSVYCLTNLETFIPPLR